MDVGTTEKREKSLRCLPADWLRPQPLQAWFDREQPLEIDLGCGKGRFLLARAAERPDRNLLGIERQLRRLRKIDRRARRAGLGNLRLLRVEAYYGLRYLVPAASVSVMYILFPDPWPKAKHRRHRLFNPEFLDALHRVLKPDGVMHFATDHLPYYHQVSAALRADSRLEAVEPFWPSEAERTDFELLFRDRKPIGRYSCRRAGGPQSG